MWDDIDKFLLVDTNCRVNSIHRLSKYASASNSKFKRISHSRRSISADTADVLKARSGSYAFWFYDALHSNKTNKLVLTPVCINSYIRPTTDTDFACSLHIFEGFYERIREYISVTGSYEI